MTVEAAIDSKPARAGVLQVAAMVTTGIAGAAITVVMPGMLAALAGPRHLSTAQTAWLASSEMAGLTAATVLLAPWVARIDRRWTAALVLLVLIAAHTASLWAPGAGALLAARFVAGVCEGALLGLMSACITGFANPDRIFAIYLTANLALSTGLLKAVATLSAMGRPDWIFLVLIATAVAPLLLAPWLPARTPGMSGPTARKGPQAAVLGGIAGIAGTLVLLIGVGATWPLAGQTGLALGLSAETVARALSIATTAGIVSGLAVYGLGQRFGRRLPIVAGTLALAGAMAGFMHASNAAGFILAASAFMFFWVAVLPYYSGVMALLDPAGRLASLCMAMQLAGLTVGPILAAALLPMGAKAPLWLGMGCTVPALALMLYAERASRRG